MRTYSTLRGLLRFGIALVGLSACEGSESGGSESGAGDFCSAMADAPMCDASQCTEYVASDESQFPDCTAQLSEMLDCAASLSMTCPHSLKTEIEATGDQGRDMMIQVAVNLVINFHDRVCSRVAQGYHGCRTCPGQPGVETTDEDTRAVGELCERDDQCAAGTCDGVCVTPCQDAAECPMGRNCMLLGCFFGQCRAGCFQPDTACDVEGQVCSGFDPDVGQFGENFCEPA